MRSGKRRRYRCVACGKTFSSTKGTPYYRLQHRRATFEAVVALRVEGVSISAVARVEGLGWNAVARWLEKAADVCRRFNQRRTAGFGVMELQADEIRSFAGSKTRLTWIFVSDRSLVSSLAIDSDRKTKLPKREARSLCCATSRTGWISSIFP